MLAVIATIVIGFNLLVGITTLATGILRHPQTRAPLWLGTVHGAIGLTGLLLLYAALIAGPGNWGLYGAALIFTAVAAAGVAYGIAHWRGKAPAPGVMIVHGIAAVLGFVFLAVGTATAAGELR